MTTTLPQPEVADDLVAPEPCHWCDETYHLDGYCIEQAEWARAYRLDPPITIAITTGDIR